MGLKAAKTQKKNKVATHKKFICQQPNQLSENKNLTSYGNNKLILFLLTKLFTYKRRLSTVLEKPCLDEGAKWSLLEERLLVG